MTTTDGTRIHIPARLSQTTSDLAYYWSGLLSGWRTSTLTRAQSSRIAIMKRYQ